MLWKVACCLARSHGGKRVVSCAVRDGLGERRMRCPYRELEGSTAGEARVRRIITWHCGEEALVIFYRHGIGAVEDGDRVAASNRHSRCALVLRVDCAGIHQLAHAGSPGAAAISRQSRRALQTPVRLSSLGAILGRQTRVIARLEWAGRGDKEMRAPNKERQSGARE